MTFLRGAEEWGSSLSRVPVEGREFVGRRGATKSERKVLFQERQFLVTQNQFSEQINYILNCPNYGLTVVMNMSLRTDGHHISLIELGLIRLAVIQTIAYSLRFNSFF